MHTITNVRAITSFYYVHYVTRAKRIGNKRQMSLKFEFKEAQNECIDRFVK